MRRVAPLYHFTSGPRVLGVIQAGHILCPSDDDRFGPPLVWLTTLADLPDPGAIGFTIDDPRLEYRVTVQDFPPIGLHHWPLFAPPSNPLSNPQGTELPSSWWVSEVPLRAALIEPTIYLDLDLSSAIESQPQP